jgi:hypothetical protein
MIGDWLLKVSIYFWLAAGALLMFVFSLNTTGKAYLDLWLVTFLYGLWGFAVDNKIKNELARNIIHLLLLLAYTAVVFQFLTGRTPQV